MKQPGTAKLSFLTRCLTLIPLIWYPCLHTNLPPSFHKFYNPVFTRLNGKKVQKAKWSKQKIWRLACSTKSWNFEHPRFWSILNNHRIDEKSSRWLPRRCNELLGVILMLNVDNVAVQHDIFCSSIFRQWNRLHRRSGKTRLIGSVESHQKFLACPKKSNVPARR